MKSKYDLDHRTPLRLVRQRLAEARAEGRIYVIANIVRVLHYRGHPEINLSDRERVTLFKALQSVRAGRKVLAHWLPLGYQLARLLSLARRLSGRRIRLTRRDEKRIRHAARWYRNNDDWHNRRQLRSLVLTAKDIGLDITQ